MNNDTGTSHHVLALKNGGAENVVISGDKGEAGEKGRTGDFGFPGPQVHIFYFKIGSKI
jgi:hypothetical protein